MISILMTACRGETNKTQRLDVVKTERGKREREVIVQLSGTPQVLMKQRLNIDTS